MTRLTCGSRCRSVPSRALHRRQGPRRSGPQLSRRPVRRTTELANVAATRECWAHLQADVAGCTRCRTDLPRASVECPAGLLYPQDIQPPDSVRVLFLGVAPPKTGHHFYTDESDNLRRGLFDVLRQLSEPRGRRALIKLVGCREIRMERRPWCRRSGQPPPRDGHRK